VRGATRGESSKIDRCSIPCFKIDQTRSCDLIIEAQKYFASTVAEHSCTVLPSAFDPLAYSTPKQLAWDDPCRHLACTLLAVSFQTFKGDEEPMPSTKEILDRLLAELAFALESDRGSIAELKSQVWHALDRAQRAIYRPDPMQNHSR
jgi:hypothetical protein